MIGRPYLKAIPSLALKEYRFINPDKLEVLLKDFQELGAEQASIAQDSLGIQHLDHLLREQFLTDIPSPLGKLYLLGPKGREHLGLSPFYKSPPEAAASQVIRRRVKEILEREGWDYKGKTRYSLYRFQDQQGKLIYSAARYRDYSARSIRRILASMKPDFIHESSHLLVWAKKPHYLAPLKESAHPFLDLRPLIRVKN
ncbi:MAG: hypothetical protein KC422_24910 [Trueperaceae bacterium]|nr:hypothetical protein [Trueperaceae bacterium]